MTPSDGPPTKPRKLEFSLLGRPSSPRSEWEFSSAPAANVGCHLKLSAGGQWVPDDGHYGVWSARREDFDDVVPGPGERGRARTVSSLGVLGRRTARHEFCGSRLSNGAAGPDGSSSGDDVFRLTCTALWPGPPRLRRNREHRSCTPQDREQPSACQPGAIAPLRL